MSKFYGRLSYKDWCILKHGLQKSIEQKEEWIQANSDGVYETMKDERKELEEEKAALERVNNIVDRIKGIIRR